MQDRQDHPQDGILRGIQGVRPFFWMYTMWLTSFLPTKAPVFCPSDLAARWTYLGWH